MKRTAMFLVLMLASGAPAAVHPPLTQSHRSTAPQPATAHFHHGGNAAEIPADFIDDLVFIPVRVDQGQPSFFELNTTARFSSIDPGRARELGRTRLASAVLNLSGLEVSFTDLTERPMPGFASRLGRRYQGTLGNDFLGSLVAAINYQRETLQLYDPSVYHYRGHGKDVRVTFVRGIPVVEAKFTIGGRTFDADFAVNTALDAPVLVYDRYAERHQLSLGKSISAASVPLEGADQDALGRLRRFQLGPYRAEASLVVFSRRPPPTSHDARLAGEIGAQMLRRFFVVLDYPQNKIYIEPNRHFRSEDFEDMSGLTLAASGPNLRKFEITAVRPNTPGADAGLRPGDILEGINGDAAANLSLTDIRQLFHALGPPCTLVITRNGRTFHVQLQLRRLL